MDSPGQDSPPSASGPTVSDRFALLLGQWWGTGLSPKAPGTVGSVGAVPLFLAVRSSPHLVYWGVTLLITALGFWASQRCSELLGDKDPQSVVIDEVSGVMIAMGLVRGASPSLLVAAWISFRILDITKPALIDRSQYLRPSGVGIMADDILAGLVAGALCSAYAFFGGPH